MNSELICHQVESVNFDIYTTEEIRKMSVKQVTNPIAFNTLGRPMIGGVHDPAMGVSPYDNDSVCPTCGKKANDCPGHFGHIELPASVYNPFAIGYLYKLLSGKCFNCHKLRMREKDKKFYYVKLLLIKLGLVSEAKQFESIIYSTLDRASEHSINDISNKVNKLIKSLKPDSQYSEDIENFGNNFVNTQEKEHAHSHRKDSEFDRSLNHNTYSINSVNTTASNNTKAETVDENGRTPKIRSKHQADPMKKEYDERLSKMNHEIGKGKSSQLDIIFIKVHDRIRSFGKGESLNDQNTDIQLEQKKCLKDFWSNMKLSKCPHCHAYAVKVKKQGFLRFFKMPMSKTRAKQNNSLGLDTGKSALISKSKGNSKRKNNTNNKNSTYSEELGQINNTKKTTESMMEVDDQDDDQDNNINDDELKHLQEDSDVEVDDYDEESDQDNQLGDSENPGGMYISDKLKKLKRSQADKKRNLNEDTVINNADTLLSNIDVNASEVSTNTNRFKGKKGKHIQEALTESQEAKYLHPEEVKEHIKRLWNREGDLLSLVFGNIYNKGKRNMIFSVESTGTDIFFIEALLVTPNRFRPENRSGGGDSVYLHQQSVMLTRILNISADMKRYSDLVLRKNTTPNTCNTSNTENAIISNEQKNEQTQLNTQETEKVASYKDVVAKWIDLQDNINVLYDGMKASKLQDKETTGIRQILEKKEGIFRMKMMGKRVNYAGRSVISPDPMISTGEVGVPTHIALKLTIPEYVTEFNKERIRKLFINGPFKHPGANIVETQAGQKISLDTLKSKVIYDKLLLSLSSDPSVVDTIDTKFRVKILYRHMQSGDALLVNRQPTLHKPSIMAHRAKVLKGEKTIRLNYSNCSSYNADFDGDEMNIHLLQSQTAREEAYSIANTENQYIVPTSGNPIRGLIQDAIISSVLLTMKDNFFTKADFFQLIYSALENPLNSGLIKEIVIPEPAILKPKLLFTGKQAISCILRSLVSNHPIFGFKKGKSSNKDNIPSLNMEQKSKLSKGIFTASHEHETVVIIRGNELVTGIIDKNQLGNSEYGIVHSFYEIYGPNSAGELLTILGRLLINHLQFFQGFTTGVGDLLLTEEVNLKRRKDIEHILKSGMTSLADMFDMKDFNLDFDNFSNRPVNHTPSWNEKERNIIAGIKSEEQDEVSKILRLQNFKVNKSLFKSSHDKIDEIKEKIKQLKQLKARKNEDKRGVSSDPEIDDKLEVLKKVLSDLIVELNNNLNLESLRTKLQEKLLFDDSVEGNIDNVVKSALSDASKVANNWISTGLIKKFPKNFFSLMVITGAKGSAFNHIQISCLLRQQELEGRRVPRMASGKTLPSFNFFDPNPRAGGFISDRFGYGIRPQEFFFHSMAGREGLIDTAVKTSRSGYLQRCLIKHLEQLVVQYDSTVRDTDGKVIQFLYGEDGIDPVCCKYINNFDFIKKNLDSYAMKYPISKIEKYGLDHKTVSTFLKQKGLPENETTLSLFNPARYIGSKSDKIFEDSLEFMKTFKHSDVQGKKNFKKVIDLKYFKSLVQPGENVGILAAQSIGEPSTQMTLNTFHLAGHGGANMTLGVPRLREILMTSEKNIKTPIMVLKTYFNSKTDIELLAREFEKHYLIDIVKEVVIVNDIVSNNSEKRFERIYAIEMQMESLKDVESYFQFDHNLVKWVLKMKFLPVLAKLLNKYYTVDKANKGDGIKVNKVIFDEENEIANNKDKGGKDSDEVIDDDNKLNSSNRYKDEKKKDNDSDNSVSDGESVISETHKHKKPAFYDDKNEEKDKEKDALGEEDDDDEGSNDDSRLSSKAITTEKLSRNNITNMEIDDGDVRVNNNKNDLKETKLSSIVFGNIQIINVVFNPVKSTFSYEIKIPYTQKPILVKNIIENVLKQITFKYVEGISKSIVAERKSDDKKTTHVIVLEGVNFPEVFKFSDLIDVNRIESNDIGSFLKIYGIEACRATIAKEIQKVFSDYNIASDARHLSLVADYMTFQGEYRSFNRMGMELVSSPFLKVSFETSMNYLTQSCFTKESDFNHSSSSRIVLGLPPKVGTGMFDLKQDLSSKINPIQEVDEYED